GSSSADSRSGRRTRRTARRCWRRGTRHGRGRPRRCAWPGGGAGRPLAGGEEDVEGVVQVRGSFLPGIHVTSTSRSSVSIAAAARPSVTARAWMNTGRLPREGTKRKEPEEVHSFGGADAPARLGGRGTRGRRDRGV